MINTEGLTLQQVSDSVAKALIDQGCQSVSSLDDSCMYGDGNGNHCAVGMMISPSNEMAMELGGGVTTLLSSGFIDDEENFEFIRDNVPFLDQLQELHDAGTTTCFNIAEKKLNSDDFKINTYAWSGWKDILISNLTKQE